MPFDFNKFEQAQFKQRTKDIDVPLLQDFFPDGETALWKIQAMTSEDLALVGLAIEKNKAMGTLLTAMMSAKSADKAEAVKKMMGLHDENMPDEVVKRIEVLLLGSVDLEHDNPQHREVVIRIAQHFPGTFRRITDEIYTISGEGPEIEGKP